MTAGKNRFRLAVEQLEDRCTPSAMGGGLVAPFPGPPGEPPAEAAALVRAAQEHAVHFEVVFWCSVDLSTKTVSSTGFATGGIGHFTALGHMDNLVIDLKADRGVYSGTGTIIDAHGDQVFYTVTTSWQLSTGKGTHFVTATGGTGRFAGASGSGVSDCIITPGPTPQIYRCFSWGSGTLFLPDQDPNLSSVVAPHGGHAGVGWHAVQEMSTVAPSNTISDASRSGGCNPSVPCDPLPPPEDWVMA
jgi:hypothetical protein